MARRAVSGRQQGRVWRSVAVSAGVLAAGVVGAVPAMAHADSAPPAAPSMEVGESPAPADPAPETTVPTGELDGAVVAVGLPPVPPAQNEIEVATGEVPVPAVGEPVVVEVGLPPVPPHTVPDAPLPPAPAVAARNEEPSADEAAVTQPEPDPEEQAEAAIVATEIVASAAVSVGAALRQLGSD